MVKQFDQETNIFLIKTNVKFFYVLKQSLNKSNVDFFKLYNALKKS